MGSGLAGVGGGIVIMQEEGESSPAPPHVWPLHSDMVSQLSESLPVHQSSHSAIDNLVTVD